MHTTTPHANDHRPRAGHAPPPRTSWAPLALLAVAQFMVVLDITIVNVALPSIGAALGFAAADLQWVVTAYVLCSGGLLIAGGRAADLLGRRNVFLAGLGVFTAASLACGVAPSPGALVAARAVQGAGAAMLTPAALAIVTATYRGPQRATALALWGAIASGGVGIGVLFGGVLTTALSWHWVFLVNVPVGVAAAALTPRVVPAQPADRAHRSLDLPGGIAVVAGLAVLVFALSGAAEHGWGSARTLGLLALAGGLLAAFALIERSVARPLLAPSVWRSGSLVSGTAIMLGATGILAGTFFLNSLYLQDVLGWSALETGLAFLPFVVAIALGVHATSHAIGRAGSRVLLVAGLLLAATRRPAPLPRARSCELRAGPAARPRRARPRRGRRVPGDLDHGDERRRARRRRRGERHAVDRARGRGRARGRRALGDRARDERRIRSALR